MYELTGVIAGVELLRARVAGLVQAVVVELRQELGLVPVTRELTGGRRDYQEMPAELAAVLAGWSADGPVAFVEAEFFGGVGEQQAWVWRDGRLAAEFGPLEFDDGLTAPARDWPINAALALLGAVGQGADLFDSVGLGAEREVADWLRR